MTLSNPAQYISGRTVQEQMNSLIDYVDQRAAEVATDAIASDVAQVHQDMLDADADAAAAAASAAAAAGTLANAVKKTGEASQTIQGDVAVTGAFSSGAASLGGNTSVAGDLSASGDLSVNGDATLSGDTSVTLEATGTYSNRAANSLKVKNELDNYAPMVRTTGNVNIDGLKGFNNFLDLLAGSVEMRVYDNTNRTNQIAGFGVRYRTATSTNASIKSYAPKVDPTDPSEVQRGGFLQLVSNQNGTVTLNIYGIKADGSLVAKTLATFDGTTWS